MGTLHSLAKARLRRSVDPLPSLGAILRVGGYRIDLLTDGAVRLALLGPGNVEAAITLRDAPALRMLLDDLTSAYHHADARRRTLRGADRWFCAPVPGDDAYVVRCGNAELSGFAARIFVPCTARKPHRCASCAAMTGPGILYRERPERGWTYFPASTRLCRTCVTTSAPGPALGARDSCRACGLMMPCPQHPKELDAR